LLATLVFFGPTMARTRIEPGADERAARALRYGATGLSIAVILLLFTAFEGTAGVVIRVAAAVALGAYAVAGIMVCVPVGRAVWRTKPTASRPLVVAVCVWLPAVAMADVVIVAMGAWRWLDPLGVAALAGVLAQAILATLVYLAPMLRGRSTVARDTIRRRLEIGTRARAATYQLGVTASVLGAAGIGMEMPLVTIGASVMAVTLLATATVALWTIRSSEPVSPAGP